MAVMPFRWLIAAFLLLGGQWDINLEPLIHPFRDASADIFSNARRRDNVYSKLVVRLMRLISRKAEEEVEAAIERKQLEERKRILEAYQHLSCDNLEVRPYDLLPLRRTVYLRFTALKAKVCRPFAG